MKNRIIFAIIIFLSLDCKAQNSRGAVPILDDGTFSGITYAFIIGISDYKNITDLMYADQDAIAFKNYLLYNASDKCLPENMEVFLNEQASRINILDALSTFLHKIKKGDRVYFYFAGHGDIEDLSQSENGLLLLCNAPEKNYFGLTDEVLQINQLAEYFGCLSSKGADIIYIIDACHSGKLIGGAKGRSQTSRVIQNILSNDNTLMLSCEPNQLSIEGIEWGGGRGIFSYYIDQGLNGIADYDKDNNVSLLELETYVKRNTYLETEKKQTPVFIGIQNRVLNRITDEQRDHLIEKSKQKYSELSLLNYKGKEIEYISANDSFGINLYSDFQKLLISNSLINQNKSNAFQKCQQFCENYPNNYLCTILRRKLITKLNSKFDSIVRPLINGRKPKWPISYLQEAKVELDSCLRLISSNHYLFPHILSRKYFLEAMILTYHITINNYGPQNKSNMNSCIELLHQSRQLEPNAAYIYYLLGRSHQTMLNTDSSLIYLIHFSSLIPNSALAHNMLGISYGDNKMFEKSIYEFKKAIRLDSAFMESYANLIYIYSKTNQIDSALIIAEKGIQINPKFIGLKNNLAELYIDLGRMDKSRRIIKETLAMDSMNLQTNLLDGIIYYKMKNYKMAQLKFRKILNYKPDFRPAIKYLSLCYKSQKEYKKAVQIFNQYTALDSTDAIFYYEIANCYNLDHKKDSADYYIDKVNSLAINNKKYFELLGDINYYYFNNPKTSFEYYKKSFLEDSFNIQLILKMCSNLIAINRNEEIHSYLQLIESIPYKKLIMLYIELIEKISKDHFDGTEKIMSKLIDLDHDIIWKIKLDPQLRKCIEFPDLKNLLDES